MPSRRNNIELSDAEIREFLDQSEDADHRFERQGRLSAPDADVVLRRRRRLSVTARRSVNRRRS